MSVIAIGPCMFLAPVVAVLGILAIPLWPVVLAALLLSYVVAWPVEKLASLVGVHALDGASATIWRWTKWMSAPWNWFDLPVKKPGGEP